MKKKFIINSSIIAITCILPLITLSIVGVNQEYKYNSSFYGGLKIKDDRLISVKDKNKIVFVGGSSLSFGLRSDLMSEALNYEVVNYGLYAPLGTKTMLELIKPTIKQNDIVVVAPELNKETYSTYMNYNMLLKCSEESNQLINRLSLDDKMNVLFNYPNFVFERGKLILNESSAPYNKESFNMYGDIDCDLVKNNILPEYYDSSQLIKPSPSLLNKDFVNYLNSYAKFINKKKAKIYFTFSPSNILALDETDINNFETMLKDSLSFPVLGTVKDLTYHQYYFYDTNYHLNYAGTIQHSKNLTTLIEEELDIPVSYSFPNVILPEPKYDLNISYEKINDDYFTFQKLGSDYYLTSVDSSLKDKQIIKIPDQLNNNNIVGISNNAFKDFTNLKYVILPSNIYYLDNNVFTSCTSLERIYFTNKIEAPQVVGSGFLNGCNPNVKLYILSSAERSFNTGYSWINFKRKFVKYNYEDISKYII